MTQERPVVSNLLGLAGVGCVLTAVGGVFGGWWALFGAGLVLLTMAWAAHENNGGPGPE
jgi:hypothetical protein